MSDCGNESNKESRLNECISSFKQAFPRNCGMEMVKIDYGNGEETFPATSGTGNRHDPDLRSHAPLCNLNCADRCDLADLVMATSRYSNSGDIKWLSRHYKSVMTKCRSRLNSRF